MTPESLVPLHQAAGARLVELLPGILAPRSYGDPAAEYEAARTGAIVVDRPDLALLRVFGRDPVRMIHGLLSNDVAGTPEGGAVYGVMLTPKGKMIADARVLRRPGGELLLLVERSALPAVTAHLKRSVPPLFARSEDVSERFGVLGVHGPEATRILAGLLPGDWPEGDAAEESVVTSDADIALRTLVTGDAGGWDLVVPRDRLVRLWQAITDAGARPAGHATLEVLRIEAGRPRWGAELTEEVIPLEAGLRRRAISETKGCYTGQEVIIRILHRGHVNRELRGILLGDAPDPPVGTALVRAEDGRPVGRITSVCASPRFEQTIALGYVRREVEPGAVLRVGEVAGPEARVAELPFTPRAVG